MLGVEFTPMTSKSHSCGLHTDVTHCVNQSATEDIPYFQIEHMMLIFIMFTRHSNKSLFGMMICQQKYFYIKTELNRSCQ